MRYFSTSEGSDDRCSTSVRKKIQDSFDRLFPLADSFMNEIPVLTLLRKDSYVTKPCKGQSQFHFKPIVSIVYLPALRHRPYLFPATLHIVTEAELVFL